MVNREVDVIVVGAGIVGSSIALRLAEKGKRVILLEKGLVGEEASGRNGGGVRQQNRHPAETPLAMESIKIWANMKDELDCDVEYRRFGNLVLILSPEEHAWYHRILGQEQRMGLEVEMLSPKETRALAPSLTKHFDIIGGKYCPTDGTANPLLVVKAICRAAKRIGVQIKEREAVTRLKMKAQRITCAVTNAGEYHANTFVNATGPWSREICYMVGLDFPATVKRDQLLITEVVPPCIGQFVSYGRMYLRQALEGNVHLWGGCHPVESPDKWITPEAFIHAAGNINGVFPHLMKVNVIRGFAGLLNCLPDEIPILDRAPNIENFFLVTGFSGHGFCLGPIVGRLISEWIVEGKPSLDMDHFRWTRFENVFLN